MHMIKTKHPMAALLFAMTATQLTACVHVEISDKQMIRPDSATAYKAGPKLTQEAIQKINPDAQIRDETVIAADQSKLEGLSLRQNGSKVTVLYFGGNLSHVDETVPYLQKNLGACKVNLVTFDYRGYGRTSGVPDTNTLHEDALRIYDSVRAQTQGKLVVHGHSMGSFATGTIASQRQPDGVILEATANNFKDMVDNAVPWYGKLISSIDIEKNLLSVNNVSAMARYQGPSLVILGEKDQQMPAALGQKVYDAIPAKNKRLLLLKEAGHTGMLKREDVQKAYCDYIQQIIL